MKKLSYLTPNCYTHITAGLMARVCVAVVRSQSPLFIPGQWTRFNSVESRLVLLIRLINRTSDPSLHLVIHHARLYSLVSRYMLRKKN